jgi:hypothetical protein
LTKEDLLKFGFTTGNAIKFLKAFTGSSSGAAAAVTSAMTSLSASDSAPLLHTEYRGVIAIVAGHVPSLSCGQCMLQHLTVVLPEVVRMDFIVQECERKLE